MSLLPAANSCCDPCESTSRISAPISDLIDDAVTLRLGIYNVRTYGALGNGTTNDTATIQDAIDAVAAAGGGTLLFPRGTYLVTAPLRISTMGLWLQGVGASEFWSQASTSKPVLIDYRGPTACLIIDAGPATQIQNNRITNIQFDGRNSTGAVDGILFGGLPNEMTFDYCAITNFPRYQVNAPPPVSTFGIEFIKCNFNNKDNNADPSGNHLVRIGDHTVFQGQVLFDRCLIQQFIQGKWGVFGGTGQFQFDACIVNSMPGANGVRVNGNLFIFGGQYEAVVSGMVGANSTGICATGQSNGHFICPTVCTGWGNGITVGSIEDPIFGVTNVQIHGSIGSNITCDIRIVDGATRAGSAIYGGDATLVILNDRFTIDGIDEVGLHYSNKFRLARAVAGNHFASVFAASNDPTSAAGFSAETQDGVLFNLAAFRADFANAALQNRAVLGSGAGVYINATTNGILGVGLAQQLQWTTSGVSIGLGSSHASALLDVNSTTQGFAPPRMTKAQRDAISSPAHGLIIYQTDNTPGIRTYENGAWVAYTATADP